MSSSRLGSRHWRQHLVTAARQIAFGIVAICVSAVAPAYGRTKAVGVTIEVRPSSDGVDVSYTLSTPATFLALSSGASLPRDARIQSPDPTIQFVGGKLIATRPVSRFTLRIQPDRAEADSTYPVLRSVSDGKYLLYLPYLTTVSPVSRVSLSFGDGTSRPIPVASATTGYVLVGTVPASVGLADFVFSASAPASLRTEITERTGEILAFYARRMGWSPAVRTTIVVKFVDTSARTERWYNRGDATENGVIFMRIGAKTADLDSSAFRADYTHFLAHELFHRFNGAMTGDPSDWWLMEGGADYMAWLAADGLWPTETRLEQRVQASLGSCATALGSAALKALATEKARAARYSCGAVIQWLEDVRLRSAPSRADIFALWRAILKSRGPHRYTMADFDSSVRRLGGDEPDPSLLVTTATNDNRWSLLAALINKAGAVIDVRPPSSFSLRLAATKSLMQSACGALNGIGEDARGLYALTPETCLPLGGDVVIVSAEGVDPMRDPTGFYRVIEHNCWSGAAIAVVAQLKSGDVRKRVQCTVAVDPPAPTFVVSRALPDHGNRRVN